MMSFSADLARREWLLASAGAAGTLLLPRGVRAEGDPWSRAAAIDARVKPPVFPARVFDVTHYGARGDGATPNTAAIAAAIKACADAGGGRVLVPAGRFLTGAVHLRSNVELHVAKGATLLFSTDPGDYPIVLTRFEGVECMNYSPLIYAYRQRNIAITGEGTLDGQASEQHWWSWKGTWQGTTSGGWREGMANQNAARARLFDMAERGVPVEKRVFGDGHYLRPSFVEPYLCENVLIEGLRLRGSPMWQLHPTLCRNVTVRGLDIVGHGPNTDGCDPESCTDLVIEDTLFDTGDDCIAIKSGRNADGRRIAMPTENVIIRRCRMKQGHGGIVIGSEISGGVRWVFGEDCDMDSPDLWYALRFKNNAMRGGVLEHFHYRDLRVGQVGRAAITCDFNYEEGASGGFTPVLRDVQVERMRVAQAKMVLDAQGLDGAPVENIALCDCRFDGVADPSVVRNVNGLRLEDVRVNGVAVTRL